MGTLGPGDTEELPKGVSITSCHPEFKPHKSNPLKCGHILHTQKANIHTWLFPNDSRSFPLSTWILYPLSKIDPNLLCLISSLCPENFRDVIFLYLSYLSPLSDSGIQIYSVSSQSTRNIGIKATYVSTLKS